MKARLGLACVLALVGAASSAAANDAVTREVSFRSVRDVVSVVSREVAFRSTSVEADAVSREVVLFPRSGSTDAVSREVAIMRGVAGTDVVARELVVFRSVSGLDAITRSVSIERVVDVEEPETAPAATRLVGNYPNPFNPSTRIRIDVAADEPLDLRVYDAAGRVVSSLLRSRALGEGTFDVTWDGRDDRGHAAGAGVYIVRLDTATTHSDLKLVLLR